MRPLPPRSTLFPYTTLFRSFKRSVGFVAPFTLNVFKNCVALVLLAATTVALGQTRTLSVPPQDLILILISGAIGIGISEDRKSTRLNSSHLGISYAVFCLKK